MNWPREARRSPERGAAHPGDGASVRRAAGEVRSRRGRSGGACSPSTGHPRRDDRHRGGRGRGRRRGSRSGRGSGRRSGGVGPGCLDRNAVLRRERGAGAPSRRSSCHSRSSSAAHPNSISQSGLSNDASGSGARRAAPRRRMSATGPPLDRSDARCHGRGSSSGALRRWPRPPSKVANLSTGSAQSRSGRSTFGSPAIGPTSSASSTLRNMLDAMPDEPNEANDRKPLNEQRPTDGTSRPKRNRRS